MSEVDQLLGEAEALTGAGRHHEALRCLVAVVEHPEAPIEVSSSVRVRATVAAIRMYDLRTARDLIDDAEPLPLPPVDTERLRLLDLVVNGLIGDASATDRFVGEVGRLLDGPLPPDDLKFVVEGLTLAIARTGRRDDLLDVVLRAAGMAREADRNELVATLLVAEAAYRSRADLAGAAHAAHKAVQLATTNGDWANLPFALAQAANADAGLGDEAALSSADQLEKFGAPAAVLVAGHARAYLAYTVGDLASAYRQLRLLDDRFGDLETPPISWHADLIELALDNDDDAVAKDAFTHLQTIAALSDMPWVLAAVDRCAGLLQTDDGEAENLTREAVRQFRSGGYAITAARTELQWAKRQRRAEKADWRVTAESARLAFSRAGMTHWAARCENP